MSLMITFIDGNFNTTLPIAMGNEASGDWMTHSLVLQVTSLNVVDCWQTLLLLMGIYKNNAS